ncbi:hypothetical protein F4604DRAFT_1930320 [Suillus subluteus]|nr:hypothetical protein F4604DRAFT_1930320 [Suillus subluteus]
MGAGKEDFETCECTFSESNTLAPETHNSSEFHRHQALNQHFQSMAADKYASLSTFVYNNYMQALNCIAMHEEFLAQFPISGDDFEADLDDEHCYLQTVGKRSKNMIEIDYVRALLELEEAEKTYQAACYEFRSLDLCIILQGYGQKEIADITCQQTNAGNKLTLKMDAVEAFKSQMGLKEHWSSTDPRLVMHLFELTKLQMSGLGYKLCTQISKALKTCATAIHNAVKHYNKYATQLELPHPALSWDQIADFTFAEFDLLHETDEQVHVKRWANPTNCQATMKYFDLQRSREEITHCNMEIVRLLTKMCNDELDHTAHSRH